MVMAFESQTSGMAMRTRSVMWTYKKSTCTRKKLIKFDKRLSFPSLQTDAIIDPCPIDAIRSVGQDNASVLNCLSNTSVKRSSRTETGREARRDRWRGTYGSETWVRIYEWRAGSTPIGKMSEINKMIKKTLIGWSETESDLGGRDRMRS